jgi:uncharacterized protein
MHARVETAGALDLGSPTPKLTTLSPGQAEAFRTLWEGHGSAVSVGVWECSPGRFTAVRDDHHEICIILQGSGLLEPDGQPSISIKPGDVIVLPLGWSGTWEVEETIRKVYVLVDPETAPDGGLR